MKKGKYLLTGGAGFIGSHLANKLIEMGQSVLVVDNLSVGNKNHLSSHVRFIKQNVNSTKIHETVRKFKPDYIFHLAAHTSLAHSLKSPKKHMTTNFLSLVDLLNSAKDVKTKKFIFSSSAAVYGTQVSKLAKETDTASPTSPYGVSKLAAEKYIEYYCRKHNMPYVSFRYSNVYGPKQSSSAEGGVVAIFIKNILANKPVTINGEGNQTRDFIYVEDVAEANLIASNSNVSGIFNISTGRGMSINKIHEIIAKSFSSNVKATQKQKNFYGEIKSVLDNSAFKSKTKWKPKTDIKIGIQHTIDYFKNK